MPWIPIIIFVIIFKTELKRMQTGQRSYFWIQLVNKCIHVYSHLVKDIILLPFNFILNQQNRMMYRLLALYIWILSSTEDIRTPCVPKISQEKGECEKAVFYGWSNFSRQSIWTFFKILLAVVTILLCCTKPLFPLWMLCLFMYWHNTNTFTHKMR